MKLEFLYHALEDTQQLIQFIESKASFAILVITGIISAVFLQLEKVLSTQHSCLIWILICLLILAIVLSIWIIVLIIKPVKAPIDNIISQTEELPKTSFYLAENQYTKYPFPFINSKKHKLKVSLSAYITGIENLDEKEIEKVLSLEILKLSYIRNIKSDRFNVLIYILLIQLVLFASYSIILQYSC